MKMKTQDFINILQKGIKEWNQWRELNPNIEIDLSGANLRDTDLRGINFRNVNLRKAKLRKSNLSCANLSHANLSGTKLNRSNLVKADFYGAELANADLNRSIVMRSDFRRADLRNVNMSHADLSEVNFTGANLRGADLTQTNLNESMLSGCNLIGVSLTSADLRKAHLSNVNFTSSNLSRANFKDAILSDVSFHDSVVHRAKFGCNIGLTPTSQADLENRGAIIETEQSSRPLNSNHFLMFDDQLGQRLIHLNDLRYFIGRNPNSSIRVFDQSVSRFHAGVYRLCNLDQTTSYHLRDGDLGGNASTNGIQVNGQICQSKTLESGDMITVGNMRIQYLIFEDIPTLPLQETPAELRQPQQAPQEIIN